jgi:hypothetical protein
MPGNPKAVFRSSLSHLEPELFNIEIGVVVNQLQPV